MASLPGERAVFAKRPHGTFVSGAACKRAQSLIAWSLQRVRAFVRFGARAAANGNETETPMPACGVAGENRGHTSRKAASRAARSEAEGERFEPSLDQGHETVF